MNVLSLHAVIICWCHQKGVMSDRVITVIAREKAINDTEDSVRHKMMTSHVRSRLEAFVQLPF